MTDTATRLDRPHQVFDAYAFDLDGTGYLGDVALPGAVEGIGRSRAAGKRVVFVTNNPLSSAAEYAAKLSRLDIPSTDVDVVMAAAYRAVRLHGATLIATNPDPYCPTPDGGLPDCAAMLAAIEAGTGTEAQAITGKPSLNMAAAVLDRLGVAAAVTAMVGDRLGTDMAMAASTGMIGVLLLSGAATRSDLADTSIQPHYVIENLSQLLSE